MTPHRLRVKPWWLRLVTAPWQWVTFSPTIYHPDTRDPASFPALVAHEAVHLRQQEAYGRWAWAWRYLWSPSFRLSQEVEGIAAEVLTSPIILRASLVGCYASQLAGADYRIFWRPAARSADEARGAILAAIGRADLTL